MRRTRRGVLVVILLLGIIVLTASPAEGSWWDTFSAPKTVTLGKILQDPDAFKAVPVNFVIQFHETTGFFNPFFTSFTPERYVNFAAWGDGQALWMAEDFANSHPLFFVAKNTSLAATVLHLAPFTRLRVTGTVESTFMGRAWIEISKIDEEGTSLTSTALGHIVTGDKYAEQDRHNAAIQHYLKAYAGADLPDAARASVAARLGRSYVETHKPMQAKEYLGRAVQLDPEDKDSKALLDKVVGRIAGVPVEEPPAPAPTPDPAEEDPEKSGEKPVTDEEGDVPPAPSPDAGKTDDDETPGKRLTPPR